MWTKHINEQYDYYIAEYHQRTSIVCIKRSAIHTLIAIQTVLSFKTRLTPVVQSILVLQNSRELFI